jgi:hypothetical protein
MSPQKHEAVMQAEDLAEPPANGGESTARQAARLAVGLFRLGRAARMTRQGRYTIRILRGSRS